METPCYKSWKYVKTQSTESWNLKIPFFLCLAVAYVKQHHAHNKKEKHRCSSIEKLVKKEKLLMQNWRGVKFITCSVS